MRDVRAALLAGGLGARMGRLTQSTCKPMVPYAGSCRLVDFSVANAARSGIGECVVLSRHCERDLVDHLLRRWDGHGGLRIHLGPNDRALPGPAGHRGGLPSSLRLATRPPELGTADALLASAEWLFAPGARDLLILHADHVYSFDYRLMLDEHRASGADVTIGVQRIERRFVSLFGMVDVGEANRVRRLVEKPAEPTSDLVFTAFCLFRTDALRAALTALDRLPASGWRHDISHDVLPFMIAERQDVRAFPVPGYWADIGTVERYHRGHMQILESPAPLTLREVPHTLPGPRPVLLARNQVLTAVPLPARAHVRDAVIYPGGVVEPGAWIERSVVLPGGRVSAGAAIRDTVVLERETIAGERSGTSGLT